LVDTRCALYPPCIFGSGSSGLGQAAAGIERRLRAYSVEKLVFQDAKNNWVFA